MKQESTLRLLAIRPAKLKLKQDYKRKQHPLYSKEQEITELYNQLSEMLNNNVSKEKIVDRIKEFKKSPAYVNHMDDLDFDIHPLFLWSEKNRNQLVKDIHFQEEVTALYQSKPQDIIQSKAFIHSNNSLMDTLLSNSMVQQNNTNNDEIMMALKLMHLLTQAALNNINKEIPSDLTLKRLISDVTVVFPPSIDLQQISTPSYEKEEPDEETNDINDNQVENQKLREKLKNLEIAHRELSILPIDERFIHSPKADDALISKIKSLQETITKLESDREKWYEKEIVENKIFSLDENAVMDFQGSEDFYLSKRGIQQLSDPTFKLLQEGNIDVERINPVKAVQRLEDEMAYTGAFVKSEMSFSTKLALGGIYVDKEKFRHSIGHTSSKKNPSIPDPPEDHCTFKAGIGDLLKVKQTLKNYELGEFAHVENVLAGESRERSHRRLHVQEETMTIEEERETKTERNLQSTERHELQNEAEKTIKNEMDMEAGLQISGSYGPAVKFSSSLNASYSTSIEESQRKTSAYSREVTEKAAEHVKERILEEQKRRLMEEIEETNKHLVDNSAPANGHIRGIYRWLNKIYDAQVFKYDQRMMYEFIIPEPAAYFLFALVDNPPTDLEIEQPEIPTYYGRPLKPENITRTNYHDFISKYQVTDAPEPPSAFKHVSYFDKQDGETFTHYGRSGKIEIDPDYEAYAATAMRDYIFIKGESKHFRVMVGGVNFDLSDKWGTQFKTLNTRRNEVSIAVHLYNSSSFSLAVDVHCRLTGEGFAKWQHDMYDAIMQAYQQQQMDYEEKVAAASIEQGVEILGRNPLENRRIEREELKKLVIMMLSGSSNISKDSFEPFYSEPVMDIEKTCENGSHIRFLEHAFEWNNLLYILYPYFWGRKSRWISALHFTDPDPDFAAFLKAGAARVQLPVRPGFERAVAHFCQFGEVWEGNDIPLRDDELYVPIIDEMTENLDKPEEGIPYPEDSQPWELTIPTSLVMLQNLEEIPEIRDILTGEPVNITNNKNQP
ncbi:hypothetical protein [Alteribacillus sp. YIM 98480]|uniref:hypothetical protein n=1 Tax=Alteribacillus sp. YIM 98480 TaxID=2606599 RepID=UPI00131D2739|nr:hypothetical protein [Alteribacillus sp. YIM 98480]